MTRTTEALQAGSRPLRPLSVGERVFLQNQQGPHPTKWDRSGIIVESLCHDQYRVKVDGSGRLTLRNRRFLRAYTPAMPNILRQQPESPPLPTPTTDKTAAPQRSTTLTPHVPDQDPPEVTLDKPPMDPSIQLDPQQDDSCPPSPDPQDTSPKDTHRQHSDHQEGQIHVPRPKRAIRPPKQYEPETGKWI